MADLQAIQERVREAVESSAPQEFIYDLLRAYDLPRSSVTKLETGLYNQATADSEILWKNRLFFATAEGDGIRTVLEEAVSRESIQKYEPRFVVATDFETIVGRDLKTDDTLDIPFRDLPRRYEFFLPWAGIEKVRVLHENPADVKAAEKMAGLYDEILKENPDIAAGAHDLNVFFARILFCLFAEDTGIFEKDVFSHALESYTEDRAGSVGKFLAELFVMLDEPDRTDDTPFYVRDFPYVNGGLFEERIEIPTFSRKARRILIESGSELNWSDINPDIFGSMIQAVAHQEQRARLGLHYTSVPNIMKVIGPLFLEDLHTELEKAKGSKRKLWRLWERLSRIKFFDPACGSGNFLIVTYKEIRKLEMELIAALEALAGGQSELYLSRISLDQFYGIEIDDFAHEIATLSLWLAEHQMNVEFKERFDRVQPYLPLSEAGHIVCGNAARLDWESVCPTGEADEVYVIGNPPYVGFSQQSKAQKEDKRAVFGGRRSFKKLDYIAIWLQKGASYIRGRNATCAFVATASIVQGEQVDALWPQLLQEDLEIVFGYRPFLWSNSARDRAAVFVVIIGLRNKSSGPKWLFRGRNRSTATNISPYLLPGSNLTVRRRSKTLSALPEMRLGNMAFDYGNLILSSEERASLVSDYPKSESLTRPLLAGAQIMEGGLRWCLWIDDQDLSRAKEIQPISARIERVRRQRSESSDKNTKALATRPHQFRDREVARSLSLVVSRTGSERREYLPVGLSGPENIITDASVIYDTDLWVFAVLSSLMHMVWVRTVAGRMKDDPRYSATLCYNTFPYPDVTDAQKVVLSETAKRVIVAREHHSEKTLADLYDPDEMPGELRQAHAALDRAVDRCYRNKPFASDEERLQVLFDMYEAMTHADNG